MFAFIDQIALFARKHDLRSLSEGFRSRSIEDDAFEVMVVAGVLMVICIVLLLIGRYARRFENLKSYDSKAELFRELCRAHGLDWSSCRLLKRLAAEWKVSSPDLLFVEPERFNPAILPATWKQHADELQRIRAKLFDTQ